jgi:enoyl-CoA hydratase/carnithine racemase
LSPVRTALRERVAWITMDRPEVRNASNVAMKRDLRDAFERAAASVETTAIVLTGNGASFCAGGDRKESPAATSDEYRARIALQQALCLAIWNVGKPVIAAINGHAIGGGLEMALLCDIRIAARSASFGTPVCRIGSIATGALHQRLGAIVGGGRAMHLLLAGDTIDADEALAIGLVTRVCDDASLVDEAQRLAQRLGSYPAASIRATKQALRADQRERITAMLALEEDLAAVLRSEE